MRYAQEQRHCQTGDDAAAPLDESAGRGRDVLGRFDEPAKDVAGVDEHGEDGGEV